IQKLFFYPIYFRIKRRGETFALIVATGLAFFATWCLHSYQGFWLRGWVLVSWPDVPFWAILVLGVWVTVVYEAKATPKGAALKVHRSWRSELAHALRTIAMFTFICLLWSMWNMPSLPEWLAMLGKIRFATPLDAACILVGMVGLGAAA